MKKLTPFLIAVIILGFTNYIIAQTRNPNQYKDQDKEKLEKLAEKFHQKFLLQRAEVERVAQEKGWPIRIETEEGVREIQYISPNGMPQYYMTHNRNAARTINTDDLWVGGSSGLNLTGSGFTAGEWDGGGVRLTHQEFDGRVTQQDSPGSTSYHSTHVAGTIIAQGQVSSAHGMAYEAELDAYDWTNDETEMTNAASGGLTLSNHSYGYTRGWYNSGSTWYWYGNPSISSTEDYLFGFYDSYAQEWDQIAYDAPHYLICKSSGNDRNDDHSGGHYYWNGSSWVYSTTSRDPDGGTNGYDCIDQHGVPKNILTVGAVNDITGGWTQPSDVVMSSFSSWGPTDDGRIKPDLVANGVYVYSTDDDADNDYTYLDGTSMSTPSVTGTLALLQDYYESLRGGYMSAAALKGLAINTANEAGPADGPDYMFGWGLMNATGAAGLITDDDTQGGLIVEGILENGQTINYTYYSNGTSDINVTLCWTDPPGTPPAASLNPTTSMLVNELDLKIYDEAAATYYAWKLNPYSPSAAATHSGENWRDNVEVVNIQSPSAGYYTLRVDHDGSLSGSEQAYALIVTGLSTPPTDTYCDARHTSWSNFEYIKNVTMGDIDNTTGRSPGGFHDYTGLVTSINKGASQTINVTINGYSADQGKAWVDWNQDGDFYDTGEEFVLGSGAGPVYSTTITAPSSAVSGYTTMRVRLTYNTAPTPCGTSSYGETEDYALYVTGTPGLWAGTVSTNWHTAGNWDDGNIPTSTIDVTIPSGTPYQPTISSSTHANCRNLEILSGATLTQTGTTYLHVYGAFNSDAGTFTQSTGSTYLYFNGSTSTSWDDDNEDDTYRYVRIDKDNSSNYVYMWQDMTVGVSFEIREGIFQIDSNQDWILTINGAGSNAFEVEDGGTVKLFNSQEIDVAGGVEFENGSQADVTGGTIRCGGYFRVLANAAYNIQLTGGTVEMDGTGTQYIDDQDGNTEFYDLIINKSTGTCYLYNGDLVVNNNLTITAGSFTLNGYEATVAHDCDVYGTLNMTNAADILNIGASYLDQLNFYSGSTANLSNGVAHIYGWIIPRSGCSFTATTNNTIIFNGISGGGPSNFEPTATYGNIEIHKNANQITYIDNSATEPIVVNGNVTIYPNNKFEMQDETMIVHGILTDDAASEIYVYNAKKDGVNGASSGKGISAGGSGAKGGYLEIDNDFTLNGLLDVADGNVLLHGDIGIASTGTLDITTGTVIADQSYNKSKAWQNLYGTINLTNGLFEISHNSMRFSSTSVNNISGGIMRCGFTFYASDAGIFQPSGGTVEMTGNDPNPFILCSYANGNYFNELLIDRSNYVALHSDIEVKNDLLINSGPLRTFDAASNQYDIYVGGNWTNTGGDAAFEEGTGTVIFNGAGTGDITTTETFYNLTVDKTYLGFLGLEMFYDINVTNDLHIVDGTLEMNDPSDLIVGDDVTIELNAGLNANDAYIKNIYLGGNWTNYNSSYASEYGFSPDFSNVIFNGGSNQILTTAAPQEDFYNLTIYKGGGEFKSNDNTQAYGNILIYMGIWKDNITALTHTVWGDFTVESGGAMHTSSMHNTIIFKGTSDATLEYLSASGYFHNITVDKTSTKYEAVLDPDAGKVSLSENTDGGKAQSVMVLSYFTCQQDGSLIVEEGTLDLNGNNFGGTGDVIVNNGGILIVDDNANLKIGGGSDLTINNGGTLQAIGSAGNEATIQTLNTGYYAFKINSGGTISAEYAIFEDMDANGVWVDIGGIVDPSHAFNYCTFQNGTPGFAPLLVLNNDQTLTCTGANFPQIGVSDINVGKAYNTGHVTFDGATGFFAGPAYEYDPYNLIDWTGFVPGLWTGAVSSDWFTPENWSDYIVPDATIDVTIPAGTPNDPVVSGAAAFCDEFHLGSGASIEIVDNQLTTGYCNLSGQLIMNNSAGVLHTSTINWQAGSSDNVTAGEIYAPYWYWQDGTNAQLGTGNTAYVKSGIGSYDADASYGNLVITPTVGENGGVDDKGLYTIRISGDCLMESGISWQTPADWIINGTWEIENGASFRIHSGALDSCDLDFTLDGKLELDPTGSTLVHGLFYFGASGILDIDDASFICDAAYASGWGNMMGSFNMTVGLFEITNNYISFSGTSNVSGGIIRTGMTFHSSVAGAFQPTGGTVELVGSSVGAYVQVTNGNYFYNLVVDRSASIGIHPGSPLTIQNDLSVNSTFNSSSNTITVNGNIDVNSGGSLNVNANGTIELSSGNVLNVLSGGTLSVVGSSGNEATITHSSGYYDLQVMSGGTISAEYGIFEYMASNGINLLTGAVVDAGHPFDNCLFRNGAAGGRLLTVNSNQNFTVDNAIFPTNTWGGAYNVYKSVDAGVVNFNSATGGFHGEAYDYDPFNRVNWTVPSFNLNLTVFLEGPFNPSTNKMDTDINGLLPTNHPFQPTLPYFGNPSPDWYYTGSESAPTPNIYIVDWVLVELRDATSAAAAAPGTMIAQQAAFVLNTGEVVDLNGGSLLNFTATVNNGLYVVIWQRNHLGVLSANALSLSGGTYTYNFSTGSGQAHGGAAAHKQLSSTPVMWGMMSGDGNGSGQVLTADKNAPWAIQAGTAGYLEGDYNLNGQVNNPDKNDYWLPNDGEGSEVPN